MLRSDGVSPHLRIAGLETYGCTRNQWSSPPFIKTKTLLLPPQVNVLALIEEVKSDDGNDDVQHRGIGGGGARRPGVDDSTNATPPSSKMLARGRASHSKSSAAANSRNDADLLKEALAYSRAGAAAPSPVKVPVGNLRGGAFGRDKGAEEKAEIRATAAALLSLLIVEKQDKMRAHFHKIPFMPQLPDLPALGEVSAVLSEELGYQSLGEQLGRLTPLLKDESTEVFFFCWEVELVFAMPRFVFILYVRRRTAIGWAARGDGFRCVTLNQIGSEKKSVNYP